jgi:hypothetical protein
VYWFPFPVEDLSHWQSDRSASISALSSSVRSHTLGEVKNSIKAALARAGSSEEADDSTKAKSGLKNGG